MFEALSRDDRMLLLKFVCAFAWTDLTVTDSERAFVHRLVKKLALSPEAAAEVEAWLHVAPSPSEVEPKAVPAEHRRTFVETLRALIYVDGNVDLEERAQFERMRAALLG